MNKTAATQFLIEQDIMPEFSHSFVINFDDGRQQVDLALLLVNFARKMINMMGGDQGGTTTPYFRAMSNGTNIMIRPQDIPFYNAMCGLTYEEKFELFMGDEVELDRVLEGKKAANTEKLRALLKDTWYWRMTGERYTFSDKLLNHDMFGLAMDKTQLLAKLKNDNLPRKNITNLLAWFESQDELKTKDDE